MPQQTATNHTKKLIATDFCIQTSYLFSDAYRLIVPIEFITTFKCEKYKEYY